MNNLTFCDYINNANFIKIEDEGNLFKITMKAIVEPRNATFYQLDGREISTYKYIIYFSKSHLWSSKD